MLEVACEPASPFPHPHFTRVTENTVRFHDITLEVIVRRKTASLAQSLLTLRTVTRYLVR